MNLRRVLVGLVVLVCASGSSLIADSARPMVADLTCISIRPVILGNQEKPEISQKWLRETAYVALKAKLPRLQVVDDCSDRLIVGISVVAENGVYGGVVRMRLFRRVRYEVNDVEGQAVAWGAENIFVGSKLFRSYVAQTLDEQMTSFAADYYRAGNG